MTSQDLASSHSGPLFPALLQARRDIETKNIRPTLPPYSRGKRLSSIEASFFLVAFPFICGASCSIYFRVIGVLSVGQFLLCLGAIDAIWRWGIKSLTEGTLGRVMLLLLILVAGLSLSDVWNDTPWDSRLKGYARIFTLVVDTIALLDFMSKRLTAFVCFVAGFGVGGAILAALVDPNIFLPVIWKAYAGIPTTLLIVSLISLVPSWGFRFGFFVLAGCANVILDFRCLGGFCFAAAGIVWIQQNRKVDLRMLALGSVFVIAALAVMLFLTLERSADEAGDRQNMSNVERMAAFDVSVAAICDSPVLGYGSWPEDRKRVADFVGEVVSTTRRPLNLDPEEVLVIPYHSQVLQAWVEGGVLGVFFFLYYAFKLAASLRKLALGFLDQRLVGLFTIILVMALWDVFCSPLGASHIPCAAMALAIIVYIDRRWARGRRLPESDAAVS